MFECEYHQSALALRQAQYNRIEVSYRVTRMTRPKGTPKLTRHQMLDCE